MPNGDPERARRALRAIERLRAAGMQSTVLDEAEARARREAGFPTPLETAAGLTIRTAVSAAETVARGIGAFLRGPYEPSAEVTGVPPEGLGAGFPVTKPGIDLLETMEPITDFGEAKRLIDEAFEISGVGQIATEAVGDLVGMGLLGYGGGVLTIKAIGPATLSTRAVGMERFTGLLASAVAGAVAEPGRTAPIPEGPPEGALEYLDVPGQVARVLTDVGIDRTAALQVSGAAFGAVLGGLFDLVSHARRLKAARWEFALRKGAKERSTAVFIEQFGGGRRESFKQMAERLAWDFLSPPPAPTAIVPRSLSGVVAEQMTNERLVLGQALETITDLGDNAVIKAANMGNPEGINLVKGVNLDDAQVGIRTLEEAGAELDVLRFKNDDGTYDLLIGNRIAERPDPNLLTSEESERVLEAFRRGPGELEEVGRRGRSVRFIAPDGTVWADQRVYPHGAIADEVFKEAGVSAEFVRDVRIAGWKGHTDPLNKLMMNGYVRVWDTPHAGSISFEVMRRPTFEQMRLMEDLRAGRSVLIDFITKEGGISAFHPSPHELRGNVVRRGVNQVGDDLLEVGGPIPVSVRPLTSKIRQQYAREGVFEGQGATLGNGMPVEIVSRDPVTGEFLVRNPLTNNTFKSSSVTPLNTTYTDFQNLDEAVLATLTGTERQAFTKLRAAMIEGAKRAPVGFRQLEDVAANTAGVRLVSAAQGEIQIIDIVSGDMMRFDSVESAMRFLNNYKPMFPDLTPTQIRGLSFGMGFIGGGGPPLKPGEMIPIPEEIFFRNLADKRVGIFEFGFTPTDRIMLRLERRTGIPLWTKGFQPLQRQAIARNNFQVQWAEGKGPPLPAGVKPLKEIRRIAGGRKANAELITDWLEAEKDIPRRLAIEADMTPREIRAAGELRKWYTALFDEFGLDYTTWISNYAPHMRQYAPEYGNSVINLWRKTKGRGVPLPNEIRFVHEMRRFGTMNIYEKNAFLVAGQYLRGGANKRFLGKIWKDTKRMVSNVNDRAITQPLTYYLEALRGVEFAETRAMMQATMRNIFVRLPGVAKTSTTARVADDFALTLLSLSYQATMGFRPGLAIRNLTQTLQTTWTLFGMRPNMFVQAVSRALTQEGRQAAANAGAIARRATPVFAGEEILDEMPPLLAKMSEMSLKMYTGADEMNRAIAFHMGKLAAEDAVRNFARRTVGITDTAALGRLRQRMLVESNAVAYDRPVINEFLRRLQVNADDATDFLGKRASDVTQFLYGRGNQPRYWRSAPGRFLGQFGTWPMWYINYVGSTTRNLLNNAGPAAVARFYGRLAIANMAILAAGNEVLNIDLGRWMAWNSVFYTGGPGVELIVGLTSAVRGVGTLATMSDYNTTYGKQRLREGLDIWERTLRAFIPAHYAVRDAARFLEAGYEGRVTEAAASFLGTRPTQEFMLSREADAVEIFLQGEPDPDDPWEQMKERISEGRP